MEALVCGKSGEKWGGYYIKVEGYQNRGKRIKGRCLIPFYKLCIEVPKEGEEEVWLVC